jgi:hypothetical protein
MFNKIQILVQIINKGQRVKEKVLIVKLIMQFSIKLDVFQNKKAFIIKIFAVLLMNQLALI